MGGDLSSKTLYRKNHSVAGTINRPLEGHFLVAPYSGMEPETLLAYFQGRSSIHHFPLSEESESEIGIADKVLVNQFTFNNRSHSLGNNFDWKVNPSEDIEWLILLHKFYYAKDLGLAYKATGDERYAKKWVSLLCSWIKNVSDGFIDSQVTGRRLQQWLLSYPYFIPQVASPSIEPEFLIQFLKSVYSQTIYLCEHLTPEGNHRTIELYAIFLVAVIFPELRGMNHLLDFSREEILNNMQDDLLSDGVQRELSTDYHHTVLKNYLKIRQIASLNHIELPQKCDDLIKKALTFSLYVHKPDGFLPMISDGDSNSYLSLLKKGHRYYPDENLRYVFSQGEKGIQPTSRSMAFSKSGYYILRSDWEKQPYHEAFYLFFDCAPLGFGSHGHYDLLSFEMSAYGHTLIVDPGRYTYSEQSEDGINWRKIFKGTAYHNTVTVDGRDQMPYRKSAAIGPEPTPVLKTFTTFHGFDFISGVAISNEYAVIHERSIFFLNGEYWIVLDRLKAEGQHNYDLNFHLHPRAQTHTKIEKHKGMVSVVSPNLILTQALSEEIQVSLKAGYISPEYGVKHEAPIVTFSQNKEGNTFYSTLVFPYRDSPPKLSIEKIPIYEGDFLCPPGEVMSLKITTEESKTFHSDYFFLSYEAPHQEYTFDGIRVKAKLLMLRRDETNRVISLQADQLVLLVVDGKTLIDFSESSGKVSYQYGVLHLDTDALEFQGEMNSAQKIIRQDKKRSDLGQDFEGSY